MKRKLSLCLEDGTVGAVLECQQRKVVENNNGGRNREKVGGAGLLEAGVRG